MVVRKQEQQGGVEEEEEGVYKMSVSDFFQNYNSNFNSSSKLTLLLHMRNTKVFCVPCISCSLLPNPTQRSLIIICSHTCTHGKIVRPENLPLPEPATSYVVGKQTLLHGEEEEEESFEVTSSRKRLSTKERDEVVMKESDVDTTQHSQIGNVALAVERHKMKKQLSHRKLKINDNSIGLEDLRKHFGKRRKEAAKSLSVSVSTLKRIARQHGIASWPYSKINKSKGATKALFSQTTKTPIPNIPECNQMEVPSLPKELAIKINNAQTPKPEMAIKEMTTKSVKVKFEKDIIRFEISAASKMVDLEEEVGKRLKLEMGSFNIKYMDEDMDLVLLTCDADLSYCMRLPDTTPIRMVVNLIINLPP